MEASKSRDMTPRNPEEMLDKITILSNLYFFYLIYYYFDIVIRSSVLDYLYRLIVSWAMQTSYSAAVELSGTVCIRT